MLVKGISPDHIPSSCLLQQTLARITQVLQSSTTTPPSSHETTQELSEIEGRITTKLSELFSKTLEIPSKPIENTLIISNNLCTIPEIPAAENDSERPTNSTATQEDDTVKEAIQMNESFITHIRKCSDNFTCKLPKLKRYFQENEVFRKKGKSFYQVDMKKLGIYRKNPSYFEENQKCEGVNIEKTPVLKVNLKEITFLRKKKKAKA